MRYYVEQTWGAWEPDKQCERHEQSFNIETHSVILVAGKPAGILAVQEHIHHVHLEKLYLLSDFRNQGITPCAASYAEVP